MDLNVLIRERFLEKDAKKIDQKIEKAVIVTIVLFVRVNQQTRRIQHLRIQNQNEKNQILPQLGKGKRRNRLIIEREQGKS